MSKHPIENTVIYKLPGGVEWSFISPEPRWRIRVTTFHIYLMLMFQALISQMKARRSTRIQAKDACPPEINFNQQPTKGSREYAAGFRPTKEQILKRNIENGF
jgi:hypothetical protein